MADLRHIAAPNSRDHSGRTYCGQWYVVAPPQSPEEYSEGRSPVEQAEAVETFKRSPYWLERWQKQFAERDTSRAVIRYGLAPERLDPRLRELPPGDFCEECQIYFKSGVRTVRSQTLKDVAELSCDGGIAEGVPAYKIDRKALYRDFLQAIDLIQHGPLNAAFVEEIAQDVFDSIRSVLSDDDPPVPYAPRTKIRIKNFGIFHRDEHGKLVFECDPEWESS